MFDFFENIVASRKRNPLLYTILVVIILKKVIFAKSDTFHLNVEISLEKRRKGKTRKKSLSNGI
jgi:hypothetical protein